MTRPALSLAFLLCLGLPVPAQAQAPAPRLPGPAELASTFLAGTCPMNPDATLNVVIDRPLVTSGNTGPFTSPGRIPRSIRAGEPVRVIVLGVAGQPGTIVRGRALSTGGLGRATSRTRPTTSQPFRLLFRQGVGIGR